MPEYPDLEVYREALWEHLGNEPLAKASPAHPFLLRTVDPPITELSGRTVVGVGRIAKQLVLHFDNDCHAVFHLMIAGRFRWAKPRTRPPGRIGLAAFHFASGTLILTEAGTKRRASLCLVRGRDGLSRYDPGGVEVFDCTEERFHRVITSENHTIKRALTDQHVVAAIGNAYSDEILHSARMSPFTLTSKLGPDDSAHLLATCRQVLAAWRDRLRPRTPGAFPKKVTAFHPDMSVHGRYGEPCPVCGTTIQRIRYAENESNYCPICQTGGKIYSDRALARLLKDDWPQTVEELAEMERRNAERRDD